MNCPIGRGDKVTLQPIKATLEAIKATFSRTGRQVYGAEYLPPWEKQSWLPALATEVGV